MERTAFKGRTRQAGSVAIEFTLVAIIFFTVVFATLEVADRLRVHPHALGELDPAEPGLVAQLGDAIGDGRLVRGLPTGHARLTRLPVTRIVR